jgi:hypothetical protein
LTRVKGKWHDIACFLSWLIQHDGQFESYNSSSSYLWQPIFYAGSERGAFSLVDVFLCFFVSFQCQVFRGVFSPGE